MGRRSVTSFDDVFSTKFRGVICDVLGKLNDQSEIEHVDSLYPRRTDLLPDSSSSTSQRRLYTFEHFVEHLDENDPTFHNLMELLITITARKAILKAADLNDTYNDAILADGIQASPITSSTSSASAALRLESRLNRFSTRTSRECQREVMRSRAVQGEIRGITQRNRRHRRNDESSSSSDSLQGTTPPPTRTVFSTLTSAPETTLISAESGGDLDGATSRIYRVSHPSGSSNNSSSSIPQPVRTGTGAYRWLQRDISSIRRRLDQRREDITGRSSSNPDAEHASTPIPRRSSGLFSISRGIRDGSQNAVPSMYSNDNDSAFVQRFLTQTFPSDERSSSDSSSSAPSRSTQATSLSSRGGLDSTLAPQLDTSSSRPPTNPSSALISMDDAQSGEVIMMLNALNEADVETRVMTDSLRGLNDEGNEGSTQDDGNLESQSQSIDQGSESRLTAIRAALNRLDEARSRQTSTDAEIIQGLEMSQMNEFESFSARRRQESRAHPEDEGGRGEEEENDDDDDDEGQARLDRALEVLSRADETLQTRMSNSRPLSSVSRRFNSANNRTENNLLSDNNNRDPLSHRLERPTME